MSDDDGVGNVGCGCFAMLIVFAATSAACGLLGLAIKFMWRAWSTGW